MANDLLTVAEVAAILGITPRAVRQRIHAGGLRGVRVRGRFGAEWRVAADDLQGQRRPDDDLLQPPPAAGTAVPPAHFDILSEQMATLIAAIAPLTERIGDLHPRSQLSAASTGCAEPDANGDTLAAIVRHLSELERKVEEESRLRRREAQEIHATLQAFLAGLQERASEEGSTGDAPAEAQSPGLGGRARGWLRGSRR